MNELARLATNIQRLRQAVNLAYTAGDIDKAQREELIRLVNDMASNKLREVQTETVETAIDWTLAGARKGAADGREPA